MRTYQMICNVFGTLAVLATLVALAFDLEKKRFTLRRAWASLSALVMLGGVVVVGVFQDLGKPQSIWTFGLPILGYISLKVWIVLEAKRLGFPVQMLRWTQ